MKLVTLTLESLPPFGELTLSFCDDRGVPRPLTVFFGGGGVGKTTIVSAITSTRPGHATSPSLAGAGGTSGYAVCDWSLGADDASRPHPLRIASPMVRLDVDEQREAFRRREQALFDKLARESGFVFLAFPSTRWFSRQPLVLSAPGRTLARYDVRSTPVFDDATRAELGRETKQALAYAEIVSGLGRDEVDDSHGAEAFGRAMRHAVETMAQLGGSHYYGLDPITLDPTFRTEDAEVLTFDSIPTHLRHLISFVALPVRALWAAYRGRNPLDMEATVCIDELELHQDATIQGRITSALRAALPNVQWIVTTTSPMVAGSCEQGEVFALRRLPAEAQVELFHGAQARLH